jgi:alpha-L-fucosidase 2
MTRHNSYVFSISILLFLTAGALSSTAYCQKGSGKPVSSSFNPLSSEWNISWPGRVSKYDLVCLSPPADPMQGIPLGNGETGVLFWCEDSKIIAAVNKSDLWDDAPFGPFHNWSSKEEDLSTTLRHACRIVFDFRDPVFSPLYLTGFKARLNLADGSLIMDASSPFGKVGLKAIVDHKTGMLFFNLISDLNEDHPVNVILERFGSRTYSHWYSQINRDAAIGLSGTEAFAGNEGVFISQKLSTGTFAAGGSVIADNGLKVSEEKESSRRALITISGPREKHASLAFTVTSPQSGNPVAEAEAAVKDAASKGIDSFVKSNSEEWKGIWQRSFMDYGDDYLNALWHLTMFYANASQGGHYPGRFNNGIWSWDRDVQNWNFYFHWNQQQLLWPLNAAGFHELVDPYLNFRFGSLPQAMKDAKDIFNSNGAFISDVTEHRGFNSGSENTNHTPVAEIALDFWRQYRFTCDKKFLEEKALPFITEAARFFESLFLKEDDGLYHAKKGTGYEGWIEMHDGLTELVYARALFKTAIAALEAAGRHIPEDTKWKDILNHLAPLPAIPAGPEAIASQGSTCVLRKGFNTGKYVADDTIFSAGWGLNEKRWLTVYFPVNDSANFGLKLLDGIFPSVPSSPVFPSGVIGLKDKGTPDFRRELTTTMLYGREITGWDPVPVVMARLGMKDELETDLKNFPGRWQIYCNGWGHWGVEGEANKDAELFFRTNMVRDAAHPDDPKFPLPMWPFRHMSMESMSVLATAMNESLLQSYDGLIRVFPAFPDDKPGRFTLHAQGGFIISSEKSGSGVEWICIKSLSGNNCRIELPWNGAVSKSETTGRIRKISGKLSEFRTIKGEVVLLLPPDSDPAAWTVNAETRVACDSVRYHPSGKTRIGIPRMY